MAEGRDIAAEVRRIIKDQLDVEEKDIKPESTFIDDLGADSLGLVELVLAFEEAFEIDIPDEDTEKIRTVQDAVDYIEKKKVKEMARFIQLSMAASKLAFQDGHLELSEEDREQAGCFIGVGLGGLEVIEAMGRTLLDKGPSRISPYFIPSVIANLAAG